MTGSKRRYAAITSGGRHRRQTVPLLCLPMDHCYPKQHGSKKNTKNVLEVTLNLISIVGTTTWTPSRTQLVHFVFGEANRAPLQKSFLQPRHQPALFEHTTCPLKRFLVVGFRQENFHRPECFLKNYQYRRLPISWRSWRASVVSVPKSTASSWLGGSNS